MTARLLFRLGGLVLGRDNRLSTSKCMAWLLAALNAGHVAPPEIVQLALIAGSYGRPMLSEWLARSTFALAASTSSTAVRTESHVDTTTRTVIAGRRRESGTDEATP